MNDGLKAIGTLKILKYERERLIEERNYKNLITNIGLDYLLKLIGGDNIGGINKMAVGSGTTTALKTDIALNNKLSLLDVSKDYSISGKVSFTSIIPENTVKVITTYSEAGLVFKSTTSEILITRLVFGDVLFQKPENSLSFLYSLELQV